MSDNLKDKIMEFLEKNPKYVDLLELIVEFEKKNGHDVWYPKQVGLEWDELLMLLGQEVVVVADDGDAEDAGYRLANRSVTEQVLEEWNPLMRWKKSTDKAAKKWKDAIDDWSTTITDTYEDWSTTVSDANVDCNIDSTTDTDWEECYKSAIST